MCACVRSRRRWVNNSTTAPGRGGDVRTENRTCYSSSRTARTPAIRSRNGPRNTRAKSGATGDFNICRKKKKRNQKKNDRPALFRPGRARATTTVTIIVVPPNRGTRQGRSTEETERRARRNAAADNAILIVATTGLLALPALKQSTFTAFRCYRRYHRAVVGRGGFRITTSVSANGERNTR